MFKNILVTGANGQLGQEISTLVQNDEHILTEVNFFFTDRDTLDITHKQALDTFVSANNITTIINCAAYTAVDKAETDEVAADFVNRVAVENLAQISKDKNLQFIHVSTDYVFDGESYAPLDENAPTNPQGVYASTKLAGEEALMGINPDGAIIIRTSWVYSSFGQNFVHTMMRLGKERDMLSVVADQIGTPTYARDLAGAILSILSQPMIMGNVEIYHYSNEGVASWYDFAKAIFEIGEITCEVNPIPTEAYPTPAKRPYYSVLDKAKIRTAYNLEIPYWRDSLKECIAVI